MGYNIDLVQMFGDFKVNCPHCGFTQNASETDLTDKDVDCTDYNPKRGIWVINHYCNNCEKSFYLQLTVSVITQSAQFEADQEAIEDRLRGEAEARAEAEAREQEERAREEEELRWNYPTGPEGEPEV